GGAVHRGRRVPGLHRRPDPACRRRRHPRRGHARLQPRGVARAQRAAADEPVRHRRRHRPVFRPASPVRPARDRARLAGPQRVPLEHGRAVRAGQPLHHPDRQRQRPAQHAAAGAGGPVRRRRAVRGLAGGGDLPALRAPSSMPLLGWFLWFVMVACTAWTIRLYRQRLLALLVVGGIGLMVSMAFVFLSAPDLALTQLLVEMVSLALLLLGLHYLPPRSPPERRPARRYRDIGIAAAAGLGVALLAYAMMTRDPSPDAASVEMLARSLPEAYGRNVVNVILVDFRGFDTFGEITVFGVAALIVHALLRRARMAPEKVM